MAAAGGGWGATSPTVPDAGAADDMVDDDEEEEEDMVDAAGYYSSESYDEAWPEPGCVAAPGGEIRREYALHHYNADPGNEVKYELVEATHSNCIFVGYAHVNFVARPRGGSKERLFFAELERDTMVPTCLRSLDSEDDRVGGLAGEPWEDHAGPDEALYCFACHDALKHPKDGTCYKAGH
ncbi:hypothetical protein SETIT_1G023700v2 [Setaria italica]|uniref:DUF3615 domain-containing protein n=1 Tax=Setaria italica TaxID=4555 RepID=A0A368PGD8_SETIT|nr:hypothetical protein SETIT_1G023700v2 [Setaria italica]